MISNVNAKKSIKKIAVLFTDVIGSTRFFKSYGNLAGRKMLQQHEDIVSKAITKFGGTVVKNMGDSVLAFFANPQEATKVAIRIQKEFNRYNKQKDAEHEIHIRIGIHFGDGIIEDKDIFGNVVNIAFKLTNLAGANQIFISHDVFALVNTLSSLQFEPVEIPDKNDASTEPAIYQVLWDKSIDFDPTMMSVIYMRPVRELEVGNFDNVWDNLIKAKALFWNGKIDDEAIMDDQSVILIAKSPYLLMDVAGDVLKFLMENLSADKETRILPVQIIIDAGPCLEIDRLVREGFKADWEGFHPGTIHMSHFACKLIEKEQGILVVPSTSPGIDQARSFYEIAPGDYKQKENALLFLYQDALCRGRNSPCFYCGSKEHAVRNCPSKHLTEMTGVLNKLGYLSFDKINDIFFAYLMSSEEAKQKAVKFPEESRGQEPSACLGFYELKQVFQLRFFKSIWDNQSNEWDKIAATKNGGDDKGGFIWLAQDCIRVSNLLQAESLLQTCLEKYPADYRAYCAQWFLSIEKGNHFWSEHYLDKALHYAKTKPQKIFILLLLSRFYDLTGDPDKALKKIREINIIHPFCAEAAYQEIIFKFRQEKVDEALERLIKLIRMNQRYYINALIDPDLAKFNKIIHPELKKLFKETRQEAQKMAYGAERKFSTLKKFLEQSDDEIEKADAVLLKIKELARTDSYFGYLDMAYLGDSMISACRRIISSRKKEFMNAVKKTHRRTGNIFSLIRNYYSRLLSNSAYKQLRIVQSELNQISEAIKFNDFDGFREMSIRCKEISKELDEIEPELKRLKIILDIKIFLIMFLKNSVLILSVILFAGTIIFPTIVYYLNTFFPEFNISTAGNTGFYKDTKDGKTSNP
jgi:class 3 adenylate cyclase/tetratricopeptide (TPR) repeat protein